MPDIVSKEDRALIEAFEKANGVTICPPQAFTREWGLNPYDAFELRRNTWANLVRGRKLLGASSRAKAAA